MRKRDGKELQEMKRKMKRTVGASDWEGEEGKLKALAEGLL
jgi:hypothetical protein